jgi:hypothetical protein
LLHRNINGNKPVKFANPSDKVIKSHHGKGLSQRALMLSGLKEILPSVWAEENVQMILLQIYSIFLNLFEQYFSNRASGGTHLENTTF